MPLVFIHGFLGSPQDFAPVCSFLPKTLSPFYVELPGHGNTPFTEDFTTLFPSLSKMHLVGYSMGGRFAMRYAQLFPEKVDSLTLLSSHQGLATQKERIERFQIDQMWAKKLTHAFDDFLTDWYNQPIFSGFQPDLSMRKKHNPHNLAKTLLHYSLAKQPRWQPKNATFVVGERDTKYVHLYPNAIRIPNAGHMVHLENPKAVASLIQAVT